VCVYVLVTERTLEENLLSTLSSKRDLAMAALDPDSEVADVDVRTQADDIKEKLEVLLGAKPVAPVDETVKEAASLASATDRLAEAGSAFLRVALDILGVAGGQGTERAAEITGAFRSGWDAKMVTDDDGKLRFSIAMPSRETVASLMKRLAGLLVGTAEAGEPPPHTPA
jgi:hypothetical protein